ncbi:MAG: Asp-tRNA(Asn)/Glu-tRNA(Gln) amidotransferase subunit GatB, partial [Halochromatium sp.]
WIGISDGNMQEGSFRVDANVSVRRPGEPFGTRAEIKNINSFRFLQRAIRFEIERQIELLEDGGSVVQETRLYDADKDETRSMRTKEEANDYRYFPDPDLLPVELDAAFIAEATADLPELPDAMRQRFRDAYGISDYDAALLTASRATAAYYESAVDLTGDAKLAANWINGALAAALNKAGLEIGESPVSSEQLAGLIKRIQDNTLSGKIAKQVFEAIWAGEGDADRIIEAKGLKQITDSGAIERMIDAIIAANPQQVEQYRAGKEKVFGFFVGQVMKQSQGKANPQQVNALLKDKLKG